MIKKQFDKKSPVATYKGNEADFYNIYGNRRSNKQPQEFVQSDGWCGVFAKIKNGYAVHYFGEDIIRIYEHD